MVLDEASPTSSPDPYDTTAPSSSPDYGTIPDISNLPRPLPILGPFFGYTSAHTLSMIRNRIAYKTDIVKRPLYPVEVDATAYHTAKGMAISSWGPPLGVIAGVSRYYKTSEKSRFPFAGEQMKADGWWDGERIRVMGQDVAKGLRAKQLVNFGRGALYVGLGWIFGDLLVGAYAATVSAVGEIGDERLKGLVEVMRWRARMEMGRTGQERGKQALNTATGQGDKSASDLWKEHRGAIGADDASPNAKGWDDSSPTAEEFTDGDEAARLGGNGLLMSDEQMQSQEIRQQPRRTPAATRSATFDLNKVEPQPRNFDDNNDYDDASPMAANPRESAWERIRRENASATSGTRAMRRTLGRGVQLERQEQQEGSEAFAFPSEEEGRRMAREHAQREFDERVDRERRGEFGEGEGRRRW